MLEHQKFQKRSQKIQSIQDKRKHTQKENAAADEEVRKLCDEVKQKEERNLFLSDKVENNKMAQADMAAELQGLQAGEERRGSNASQTGDSCLEALWQQIAAVCAAVGPNHIDALANAVVQRFKESGAVQKQVPGRDERRRHSEEEQEQGRASQVALPRQAGSFKVHRRVVWSLMFLLFGVYLAKAEVQEDQAHKGIAREAHQDLQDGTSWMKERMTIWEDWCLKQKRDKSSQGKDPKTFEGNSQGRDPSTQERNSQGEDPRSWEDRSKGVNVSTRRVHSQRKDTRT